jgi:hypothetical protein
MTKNQANAVIHAYVYIWQCIMQQMPTSHFHQLNISPEKKLGPVLKQGA